MKPIPGYEDCYSAEEDGRIYSHLTNKYLFSNLNRRYLKVTLCKNGVRKDENIHRLIALTFIPNPENKPCIDHIDRDKHNNHKDNLRWVTNAENSSNLSLYNTNTSGEQNVFVMNAKRGTKIYNYFKVEYVRNGKKVVSKFFKTLEEAVKFRNEYLGIN